MDTTALVEFLTAQYHAIQRADVRPADLGPAREQALDAAMSRVAGTVETLGQLNRKLTHHESAVRGLRVAPLSAGLVKVSFVERYAERYQTGEAKGGSEEFVTKGDRIHRALMLKEAKGWFILEHESFDFDPSPTSLRDPGLGRRAVPSALHGFMHDRRAALRWTWDGGAAADYSERYWGPNASNYNSDYRAYDNDCTNFASQCLAAGGKTERDGDRTDNRYWFYGLLAGTTSYTWAGAQNLYLHLKNYTNSTATADNSSTGLRRGDIVFMDFDSNGDINHTMVVARVLANDVLLNYHTTNTHEKSFAMLRRDNPRDTLKGIKVGTDYV